MFKLKPTETARVLHSALGCSTFTVEELAERSSANPATVRTILFRSKSLLEEVAGVSVSNPVDPEASRDAKTSGPRAGRPSKRYRLSAGARETLSVELAHLTAPARKQLADTGPGVEAALAAAESSLELKNDPESATPGTEWELQARSQAETVRRLLPAVRDARKRSGFSERLAALEEELSGPETSKSEDSPWLERLREFFQPAENSPDLTPAYASQAIWEVGRAWSPRARQLQCLWFDATVANDPWSAKIVAELRAAHCAPMQVPIPSLLMDDHFTEYQLRETIDLLPRNFPIFVTMRSGLQGTHEGVLRLLRGPLKSLLRVAGTGARTSAFEPVPPITVLDHDLAYEHFWLDHGIENLRYYPTADPMLAGRLVSGVFGATEKPSALTAGSPLFTPRLLSGNHLTRAAAAVGFAALEDFAQHRRQPVKGPTVLVGLNRGGYLLAQMLWERGHLQADGLLRCECNPHTRLLTFDPVVPSDVGSLILIDDVVRTGRTVGLVRGVLRRQFPNVPQSMFALTAVSESYQGGPLPYELDFCAWISRDPRLRFPWSGGAEHDPNPSTYLDTTGVNQIEGWLRASVGTEAPATYWRR